MGHHGLLLLSFILLLLGVAGMTAEEGWAHAEKVLREHIKEPSFPDSDRSIADFGAVGDGRTDCTEAFRNAVAVCSSSGGGRVVVPPNGVYLTGPIVLKSNVNLHIPETAIIRFKQDPKAYLPLVRSRWEGVELMNYSPLIYAYGEKNIAITGGGTLDGNANATVWWPWKWGAQDVGRDRLFQMAEDNVPVEKRLFGEGYFLRPNFIELFKCQNVLIEGVKIINSPMWVIHPTFCTNVIVRSVTVDSHGPNNDGCDPDSCKNVLIENSSFDTGEDCVAVKSGRGDDGRRVNIPSVNVILRNCTMKDGHGGLVAGSEIAAGVRNLFAEDCHWDSPNLRYGLRIKSNPLFGGKAENVFVRNVRMKQVERAAIRVNFKYERVEAGLHMPSAGNIFVENVTSERSQYALQLEALSEAWAADISITNSTFLNVQRKNVIEFIDGLILEDVDIQFVPYRPSSIIVFFGFAMLLCGVAYIVENRVHRAILVKTPLGVVDLSKPITFTRNLFGDRGFMGTRVESTNFEMPTRDSDEEERLV